MLVGTLSLSKLLVVGLYLPPFDVACVVERSNLGSSGAREEDERVAERERGSSRSSSYIETSSHSSERYMPSYPYDGR